MADELWIVSDNESAGWRVDADGKVTTDHEYPLDGERVNISVPDAPLTEKQAFAIRDLIVDLRQDGVLEKGPAVGVQYPQRTTVDNVKQSMPFLHCWHDNCDEEWHSSADLGVSEGLPWVTPEAVEPPDQTVHHDTVAAHTDLSGTAERRRARDEKGHFVADDPDTPDVDEAWEDVPEKPAAGVPQEAQSGDLVEGLLRNREDVVDVPGQVVLEPGMTGPEVTAWQAVCNEVLGMQTETHSEVELLIPDGQFGEQTEHVTRIVQTILEVPVTGRVDEDTWTAVL